MKNKLEYQIDFSSTLIVVQSEDLVSHAKWVFNASALKPGLNALDELFHRRNEPIFVPWVLREPVSVVTGEHQFLVDFTVMNDILQCLVNTK